jgi:hypothetical protein
MNSDSSFLRWLWSDWGKPNALTRLGIPQIVTYLLAYFVTPYLCFRLTARYVSGASWEMFRQVARDPFFLSAYAVFFIALLSQQFLESKYNLTVYRWRERSKVLKSHWRDPWVMVAWVSFGCTLLLLLLGALEFPFPGAGP